MKIRLVLAVVVFTLGLDFETRSAPQPPLWGADYFGKMVNFGGTNGGISKILNISDPYQNARNFNYLTVRDLVSGQASWIDVEFTLSSSRVHRLSAFFISQAPGTGWKIYKINTSSGITNLQLIGSSTGCGWPSTIGSRELGVDCWDTNFKTWDILDVPSIKIRFEYSASQGIENSNLGKNIAAIDYLSFVEIPIEGDPIILKINPLNPYAPRYGNDGRFGEYPGSVEISWPRLMDTRVELPLTLKPFANLNGIDDDRWVATNISNIRTSPDGLFHIINLNTRISPWLIEKGVFIRLQRY